MVATADISEARKLGLDPDRLLKLKRAIEEDTAKGLYDGAAFLVAREGIVVLHEAAGHSDLASGRKTKTDDVFFIMSITKQFTATRVLMAIEEGKFTLTTPIKDLIPEFGIKGKQNITVAHILTHTSGLNTEIPFTFPMDKLGNIEAVVAALSNERVLFMPGTIVTYNPVTAHAIVAAMVQRSDEEQRPFREILAQDLFAPLGMQETALGLPERLKKRIVPVVVRDTTPGLFDPLLIEGMNYIVAEDTELPSGGAVSTVHDVFLFAEMLRRGGQLNGNRVLSPETVELATTNQTGELPNHLMDYMREMYGWPEIPAHLGLTFFVRGSGLFPTQLGLNTSPRTFGGFGAGSTVFWVDPERALTYVFLSAGLMEEGHSIMRHQRLSDMVVAAVVD
ncbi:MAG: serine hydrolase domain-containing protein [Candidatus Binatia bacterium]|jgi:CubicO group peptidase (beta-lactamase class C family)